MTQELFLGRSAWPTGCRRAVSRRWRSRRRGGRVPLEL